MHTAEKAYLKMLECAEIVGMDTVEDLFQRGFPKTGWEYNWQNILNFYVEMLTYLTAKKYTRTGNSTDYAK